MMFAPADLSKPLTSAVIAYISDEEFGMIEFNSIDSRKRWGQRAYDNYRFSPAWRAKCALVYARARHACECCGKPHSRSPLQVHHTTYKRLGNEWLLDLLAVCEPCHVDIHNDVLLGGK